MANITIKDALKKSMQATKEYVDNKVKLPTTEQITINTMADMPFIAYTPGYINSRKDLLGCELIFTAMVIDDTETEEYHEETIKITFTQEIIDGLYTTSEGVSYFFIEDFLDAEERKNITGIVAFHLDNNPGVFIIELQQGDKLVGDIKDTILTKTVKVYEKDTLIDASYMEAKLPFDNYEQFIEPSYEDDNKFYFCEYMTDPSILIGAKLMFVIGGPISSEEEDDVIDIVELEFTNEVYDTFLLQGGMYRLDQMLTPEENSRNLYGGFMFTEVGGQGIVFEILNTPSEEPDSVYYKVPEASLQIKVKGYANDTLVDKEYVDNTIAIANTHSVILKISNEELNFIEQKVSGALEYDNNLTYITRSDLSSIIDNNIDTVIFEGYERYPYKVVSAYYGFNYNECVILERAFSDSADDNYAIQRLVFAYSDDMRTCYLKSYRGDLANHTHSQYMTGLPENVVIGNSISIDRDEHSVIGESSVAIGRLTKATASSAMALGNSCQATGANSFACNYMCEAAGNHSHAQGYCTNALAQCSHAEGLETVAASNQQHVQGKYNIEDTEGKYAHIVGNGNGGNKDNGYEPIKSNAHTLDWDGNAWFAGEVQAINVPHKSGVKDEIIFHDDNITFNTKTSEIIGNGYVPFSEQKITHKFQVGKIYKVKINDNEEVSCECKEYIPTGSDDVMKPHYYLGNRSLVANYYRGTDKDFGSDTGEIFCVLIGIPEGTVNIAIPSFNYPDTISMEITTEMDVYTQLDRKYIVDVPGKILEYGSVKKYGIPDPDRDYPGAPPLEEIEVTVGIGAEIFNEYDLNIASGDHSHAEGFSTRALGGKSHAEGADNIAFGEWSHVEGGKNVASGDTSHAEGTMNIADGTASHVEGYGNQVDGYASHAEGADNKTTGDCAHVEGYGNIASAYQHVEGQFNIEDPDENYIHITGNGYYDEENNWELVRSNAHTLDWDGNAWFAGDVTIGTDNKKLATEDYVNDNVADLQGQIDELFQNVSNGKELIASAITDKGIYASGEETFQGLSDKISSLIIGAPGTTIVGYVDEENDIYISQTEVAAGSYVLKYEDQNGVLAGFDDIGNVEVE